MGDKLKQLKLSKTKQMKDIITLLIIILISNLVQSQIPQQMSFQAVVRDSDNNLMINQKITMQISILQDANKVYVEEHIGTTNINGIIYLIIGNGTVVYGNFSTINWGSGTYYIETETDPTGGNNYTIKNTSQLLSVPYAFFAKTAENSTNLNNAILNQKDSIQNANISISGDIKAEGKIYINGMQTIYIPNHSTFDGSLIIGTGGLNLTNSPPISPSGMSENLGKQNTFIGIGSGDDNTSGNQNTFVGTWAGTKNTTADQNTFIGMNSGHENTTGWHSTYVGAWAGYQNTTGSRNAFFGTDTGNYNTTGSENSFFGNAAGVFNTTGYGNSFFGMFSGSHNSSNQNSFFGRSSGFTNTTGTKNSFFGYDAGYYNDTGDENTFVGHKSGQSNTKGNRNVFVGSYSGWSLTEGSDNIFIGNHSGNHLSQKLDIVNSIAIGNGAYTVSDNEVVIGNSNNIKTLLNGNLQLTTANDFSNISFYSTGNGIQERARIVGTNDGLSNNSGEIVFLTKTDSGNLTEQMRINKNGNVGIGYSNGIEIPKHKLSVNGTVNANSYNILGIPTFLNWSRTGFIGDNGQILISKGKNTSPVWTSIDNVGLAPSIGSNNYIQNQKSFAQNANLWISGDIISRQISISDGYGLNGGDFQIGGIKNRRFYIYNNLKSADNLIIYPSSGNALFRYNLGVGFGSETTEVVNNKLAVNGNIYSNGIISTLMGDSTNWNTAFNWGNHKDIYLSKSYLPNWIDLLSNPFQFTSSTDNQLLKYNSQTAHWENWTPDFLQNFVEKDPNFGIWDKTTGISIVTSQISDFNTNVTNNEAVLLNTAKVGITADQASAIEANTAKVGITAQQVSAIEANNAKVGITEDQASAIVENTTKNSYPIIDQEKLAGIDGGAEVNVNADWNAISGDALILNKPTITVGTKQGDMQYWNGTSWVIVSAGKPGQLLQFTTSNTPSWITVLPILTITEISSITNNSISIGGIIISDGGDPITNRGVCWSTRPSPTILDNKTIDGSGVGAFTSSVTNLLSGTIYYIRAYSTTNNYKAYSHEVSFLTSN